MREFTSDAILQRATSLLQQDPEWKPITNNSVVSAVIRSNAETLAETARYTEYLFQESKWDTAHNISSILSMAGMLGYQAKRKISAHGEIYVSLDPRTHRVGAASNPLSSIDFLEDKLEFVKSQGSISIDKSWSIKDSKGNNYIPSTATLETGKPWVKLELMQGELKYVDIPIEEIRVMATSSRLDPYMYIPVTIENCEDASNITSKRYFKVSTLKANKESIMSYRIVNTLLLTESTDHDVEVYNDLYSQNLFYLKFNNDSLRGPVLDLSDSTSIGYIRIEYVESKGASGNVLDLFEHFTLTPPSSSIPTLYGINYKALNNGADEEKVSDLKRNAVKYYINNYTAGTKEAYENTILNLELALKNAVLIPTKARVFGDKTVDDNGNIVPLTCITFLASGLDDLLAQNNGKDYTEITDALNVYLSKLKSPQDTLKFIAPTYVPFAIGVKCGISKDDSNDVVQLASNIQDYLDSLWGSNSNLLDFSRDFYKTQASSLILNNFPEIKLANIELEAMSRLDWATSSRVELPTSSETPLENRMHTLRIPFSFSNAFLSSGTTLGFKCMGNASYPMRIDIFYKKPISLANTKDLHISLFIKEDKSRTYKPFFTIQDSQDYWKNLTSLFEGKKPGDVIENVPAGYDVFSTLPAQLKDAYQYEFRRKVYNDDDFEELIDPESDGYIANIKTSANALGALSDYLIYFSSNYDVEEGSADIAPGWIELPFITFYNVLKYYANFDADLASKLSKVNINLLQCGVNNSNDFTEFQNILKEYIEAYVCMRPNSPDLKISTLEQEDTVLYIDSYDSSSTSINKSNLSEPKKNRMISVECSFIEENK